MHLQTQYLLMTCYYKGSTLSTYGLAQRNRLGLAKLLSFLEVRAGFDDADIRLRVRFGVITRETLVGGDKREAAGKQRPQMVGKMGHRFFTKGSPRVACGESTRSATDFHARLT